MQPKTIRLVHDILRENLAKRPDKVALVCDGQRLTYAQIDDMANRMAHALCQIGVQRGERVVIYMPNSVELVISLFATLKANAVFFRIRVIAYNLFFAMKLLALLPWYRTFTIQTVRWRLYQVAGAVVRHVHQLLLKLKVPLERIELFCKFRLKCYELAYG